MIVESPNIDYISAKIHGMRRDVYEGEKLSALYSSHTVQELAGKLLPEGVFADHLELEKKLVQNVIDIFNTMMQYELVPLLMKKFQIENLKVVFRFWSNKKDKDNIDDYVVELPPHLAIPAAALLDTRDAGGFLAKAPVHENRHAVDDAIELYNQTGSVFYVEALFDWIYYKMLLANARKLAREENQNAYTLISLEVTIYTILTVFRAKLNYGMEFKKIRPFVIASETTAPMKKLEQLCHYDSFQEMRDNVPQKIKSIPNVAQANSIAELERALWSHFYQKANTVFYNSVCDIGIVVAFFYIKRLELANLIKIIECVHMGIPANQIQQYLIVDAVPEGSK